MSSITYVCLVCRQACKEVMKNCGHGHYRQVSNCCNGPVYIAPVKKDNTQDKP